MRVIFTLLILLGVLQLGFGIASTYYGHSVLASIRQPHSSLAGVGELAMGGVLITVGVVAIRAFKNR